MGEFWLKSLKNTTIVTLSCKHPGSNDIPQIISLRKCWFDMWQLSNTLTSVHSRAVTCGNDNQIVYICIKYHPSLPNVPFQSKTGHNTLSIQFTTTLHHNLVFQNWVASSAEVAIFQIQPFAISNWPATGNSGRDVICMSVEVFFAPISDCPNYPIHDLQ